MKSLRTATLVLTALVVPGGILLLAPMAIRAYRGWRRQPESAAAIARRIAPGA